MGVAYIGTIVSITPIPGADRIRQAEVSIKGQRWFAVVPVESSLQVGSQCEVYLPDAIVPQEERFAFMEPYKWRVCPRRFRGALSEVLVMPLTDLTRGLEEGTEIDKIVGAQKHEKPVPMGTGGEIMAPFPLFIPKTDEPDFQSVPHLVGALRGHPFYVTEKIDGTSCTVYWDSEQDVLAVCSRNWRLRPSDNVYWHIAKKYNLEQLRGKDIALQFEIAGPQIQNNPLELKFPEMFLFDVYFIGSRRYGDYSQLRLVAEVLNIPTVPVVQVGSSFNYEPMELRELARGFYPNGNPREGIVVRPQVPMYVGNQRVSFKVRNLEYKG